MAEPRPFQFDSQQRSVGAARGKRRIAWPWIALSLAVHGAIILFALMGAARGGHTELLGTLEVTVVGAPSAGDPDTRSAQGETEAKPAPSAVPRPEAPPATPPDRAEMPPPSAVPQPAAAVPPPPDAPPPVKPDITAPPQAAPPTREAAAPKASPRSPRPQEAAPPKEPERAEAPDGLALPRKARHAEAATQEPHAEPDAAMRRPEAPAPPAKPPRPREAQLAVKAPAEPRLAEARPPTAEPPAPAKAPQAASLPRAKAPRDAAAPAKPPRAGVKQAPKGQTASLGTSTGGDRLGRSHTDDTGGVLNVNLNPRFRAPPSPPIYPRQSIEHDEEGVVLVRAFVDPSGAPQRVVVHSGSGFPRLDEAALEAVRRWRFEPMVRDGRATSAWVQVPVRFRLN